MALLQCLVARMKRLLYLAGTLYASLWLVYVLDDPIIRVLHSETLERVLVKVGIEW